MEILGGSGDTQIVELWFRVTNNDNRPIGPFCIAHSVVLDNEGREYEGDSLTESYTNNCGDDINPGLSGYPYVMRYLLPGSAQPYAVRAWADFDFEAFAATWRLK